MGLKIFPDQNPEHGELWLVVAPRKSYNSHVCNATKSRDGRYMHLEIKLVLISKKTAMTKTSAGKISSILKTPSGFNNADAMEIAKFLNGLVADAFTLYIKTKNFH
jgi:hypothetical protein